MAQQGAYTLTLKNKTKIQKLEIIEAAFCLNLSQKYTDILNRIPLSVSLDGIYLAVSQMITIQPCAALKIVLMLNTTLQ